MSAAKFESIYDHLDFREFLNHYQSKRHERTGSFSRSHVCRLLGIAKTKSFFKEIVEGRRRLTPIYASKFCSVFELDPEEGRYFLALVEYNQADTSESRDEAREHLLSLRRVDGKSLGNAQLDYFSNPAHSQVRALVDVLDVDRSGATLAGQGRPPLTLAQARRILSTLENLGMIRMGELGKYEVTERTLVTGKGIANLALKRYHARVLNQAGGWLDDRSELPSWLKMNTVSISTEAHRKVQNRLRRAAEEIRNIVHEDEDQAQKVCQLILAIFQLNRD